MTMIGNIKNQENCEVKTKVDRDFFEIGKIAYFSKSENGSRQHQIGGLGFKTVLGIIVPLILCDDELFIIEMGEFEDNDIIFNGRFFYEGKYRYLIIPSNIISIFNPKDSRGPRDPMEVHILSK